MAIKKITERDQQAIANFAEEILTEEQKVSLETIASHFQCSVNDVSAIVTNKPWMRAQEKSWDLGNPGKRWWESDHNDPLFLVKLYYPSHIEKYYSKAAQLERLAQEEKRQAIAIDPEAYLEKRFGAEYVSPENIRLIEKNIDEIIERLDAAKHEYDTNLVLKILDDWVR